MPSRSGWTARGYRTGWIHQAASRHPMMSSPWAVTVLVAAAALSLGVSAVLVVRLERLGARLGLSGALLGLVAALAADTADYGAELRILVIRSGRDCPLVTLADGPMIFPLAIPALARATALLAGPSSLPPEPRSRTKRAMTGDLRPLRAALRL